MTVRFFHIRHNNSPKGGATVRVVGQDGGDVSVQVAFCSQRDSFCRATGREMAVGKSATCIPLDKLPLKLSRVAQKVLKHTKHLGVKREDTELYNRDYSFATKYFTRADYDAPVLPNPFQEL